VPEIKPEVVYIERLRLAAWMLLNEQRLLRRELQGNGKIMYVFERSTRTDALMKKWDEKSQNEVALSRYSGIVSYEIQTAVRMRRTAGLRTRLNASDKA